MWILFSRRIEVFQAGEGVGVAEGVAVGDVLLPVAGLPVAVFLGEVLAVELSEGDGLGVVLILDWSKGDILAGWSELGYLPMYSWRCERLVFGLRIAG